jgi:glycosyltransferase involved in cell wall biosynthesis
VILASDINICGVVRDNGACGVYRISQPLRLLNELDGYDVALGGVDCPDSDLYQILQDADVVFIPRAASTRMLELIDLLQGHQINGVKAPKRVIIDQDDNIFHLNPLSPHYRDMGVEDVTVSVDGQEVQIWKDGTCEFDIARNKEKTECAKACLRKADAVTTTTQELADFYSEYNKNVYVLPNLLDFRMWKPKKFVNDGITRLTWHGGASHYHDLVEIAPMIRNVLKRNKKLKLEVCGQEFKGLFKDVRKGQHEHHGWVHTLAHPYKQALMDSDIAIIPLKDDLFNRCKSAIKWIEYSSLKVPCVMKNIPPYSEVVEHGITGMLYNSIEEAETYLEYLIANPVARGKMGKNAYNEVHANHNAKDQIKLWGDVVTKVMEG